MFLKLSMVVRLFLLEAVARGLIILLTSRSKSGIIYIENKKEELMAMQKAKVVNGIYCGVKGKATKPTSLGLVMFYPHKSKPCARFWVRAKDIKYLT